MPSHVYGATSANGWGRSDMRTYYNSDLLDAFEETLQDVIKPIKILADGGKNNPTLVSAEDKVWVASPERLLVPL